MSIAIGAILDVCLEGEPTFRACVFDTAAKDGIWVINLTDGSKRLVNSGEYENPIINNIFEVV